MQLKWGMQLSIAKFSQYLFLAAVVLVYLHN